MRQIKMIRFYKGRIMKNLAVFIRWSASGDNVSDTESVDNPVAAFGRCCHCVFVWSISL